MIPRHTPQRSPQRRRSLGHSHRAHWLAVLCGGLVLVGCKKHEPDAIDQLRASASAEPSAAPDRVGPGELIEGEHVRWGFRLPKEMKPIMEFPTSSLYEGQASLAQVEEYVRLRIESRHIEVTAEKSVFPEAHIKDGDASRTYLFELIPSGNRVRLRIEDTTPAVAEPGLTPDERWKKAGIGPGGKPIPGQFE